MSEFLHYRRRLLFVAAVLTVGAASPLAAAGTVSLEGSSLTFEAAPGEANNLSILETSGGYAVADSEPLAAAGSCSMTDAGTVFCAGSDLIVTVTLGDGSDFATLGGLTLQGRVFGGPGDDTITVEGGFIVRGGSGDDVLESESYASLYGDAGNDTLQHFGTRNSGARMYGGAGRDTFVPGGGFSLVSYRDSDCGVRVDADGMPDDGCPGERDNLRKPLNRGIVSIEGGRGNDKLVATDRVTELAGRAGDDRLVARSLALHPQSLRGQRGDDVLLGGPGFEELTGGPGNDVLKGGAGRDELYGEDYFRDARGDDLLIGGRGRDYANGQRGADTLRMRDGERDEVAGGRGRDTAVVDAGVDRLTDVESVL